MASGGVDADRMGKGKRMWGAGIKVYTRRFKKGTINDAAAATVAPASSPTTSNNEQGIFTEDTNSQKQKTSSQVVEAVDNSSGQNRLSEVVAATPIEVAGNGVVKPAVVLLYDRVKINMKSVTSKNENKELSEKLKAELDQVRGLVQKLEDKKVEITSYSTVSGAAGDGVAYSRSQHSGDDVIEKRTLLRVNLETDTNYMERSALARVSFETGPDVNDPRALVRTNSEVGLVANQATRPLRKLSIAVVDKSHGVEKEKRTPKANPYYMNSEFLLGKDRLPPESNKRPKSSGRKHSRESDFAVGLEKHRAQVFKSCNHLLLRLMKHKHGWVFNDPVNPKMLGLHDYHEIIKHPMDLGTIKGRLSQNFYKFPKEFAEDIRLTFCNAMTYNPKGQDVHVMAEQLSNIFEERWAVIESEYNPDRTCVMTFDAGTPTLTSRKISLFTNALAVDRSEHMTSSFMSKRKPSNVTPVSRTHLLKKPKVKDPNKRNMTDEEKQKLGANLQSLPFEKLDDIVQIIKKKAFSHSHHGDELEVDIDSVDVETLWELDRFFTNYKKNLSKQKRKAKLAQEARAEAGNVNQAVSQTSGVEAPKENKSDEKCNPDQGDRRGDIVGRSSSTNSSSSDSESSSSDSDSGSSSAASGSDAGGSPRS